MLRQGTNRLNQGHGSDGSDWGSERTGSCARGEGSVKAAALSVEATTPVVISQGSDRGTAAGARNSELGCRRSGHGGNGS